VLPPGESLDAHLAELAKGALDFEKPVVKQVLGEGLRIMITNETARLLEEAEKKSDVAVDVATKARIEQQVADSKEELLLKARGLFQKAIDTYRKKQKQKPVEDEALQRPIDVERVRYLSALGGSGPGC